ncbi:DEAD/DEAH box helicase [Shewanella sp. AS1]|uniref:DEAD/DEAH box helicase n=1 Tax=Shewanella sp. AS1 TaxID=2907626 RepID=UPI001F41CF72|nr:DEAD/DEAH box helicase [Shewanella sp. AS1]MCE9678758.1 DEAD/DEAH box helicase [Shewanella sp. AS1]
MDFSHVASLLSGRFSCAGVAISTSVDLKEAVKVACDCLQDDCAHGAALLIEALAQQGLASPKRSRRDDTAIRLFRSEFNQQFDPFPAMVRHRVLYLLEEQKDTLTLSLYKGYLSKNGTYQIRSRLGFELFSSASLPKYVSQTDLQLLSLLKMSCSIEEIAQQSDEITLNLPRGVDADCYRLLVDSGRLFYQKVSKGPLKLAIHYDDDYFDADFLLPLDDRVFIDLASNTLVIDEQDGEINESLLSQVDLDGEWLPRIEVVRREVDFPWLSPAMLPLDLTRFTMVHRGVAYTLQQLLYIAADHLGLMTQLAKCQLRLAPLPLVSQQFERPITDAMSVGDRIIPDDISEYVVFFRQLSLAGWQLDFEAKKRFVKVAANHWYGEIAADEQDWFELSLGVEVEGERVNLLPLLTNMIRQGRLKREHHKEPVAFELDSGEILTLPGERIGRILSVLSELFDKNPLNVKQELVLPRHQLSRLPQLDDVLKQDLVDKRTSPLKWSGATWLKKQAQDLNHYLSHSDSETRKSELVIPDSFNAHLRPYQRQGVSWLQFLKQHHFAGILADDMGLGKTIQTLCSILIDKEQNRLKGPVLILAPTSLLTNWQRECQTFSPSLTTLIWSGRERHEQHAKLQQVDLVITSYGLLAQDERRLSKIHWYQVILDEAQTIKNSRSRISKLANRLQASHRLCLTGTPMENHLGELWSLFHFLMPGFLGTANQFQRQFKQPIEKEGSQSARQKLAQRIAPFMLRRTKSQVARELPEKTVINTLIDLTQAQADLYETIRLTVAEELKLALLQTGAKANRLAISNALLKLRQVCCHPAMLKYARSESATQQSLVKVNSELENDEQEGSSSKLVWLENKLPSMIEDGRSILIFSSFTSMLDLIAQQLDEQQISYEMLTGKSRHRDKIIDRFRRGDVKVFLISLKAGGAGLNLTEADVVIHVDPWWNPAAEEQASDRAYRIGQQKPVFVYKLLCKNTVEERIQQLQQSKKALAQSMYQTRSLSLAEMNRDDWLALLQPIGDEAS